MKINKTLAALVASAGISMSGQTFAAATATDTPAGTEIKNQATFSYTVGIQNYTDTSLETAFTVDQKVDLTLVWNQSPVTADVGDEFALKIDISNQGNSIQSFQFDNTQSASNTVLPGLTAAGPGPDQVDDADSATTWEYFLDSGDGSYTSGGEGTKLANDAITDLAIDTDGTNVVTIWAVAKNLDTTVDESMIGVEIRARAWDSTNSILLAETNDSGAGNDKNSNLSTEYIVNAEDPEGDKDLTLAGGTGSRDGGYVVLTEILVAAPIVTIEKEVAVTDDPINTAAPYVAIPGSTIQYTITVTNEGTGDAPTIEVTDDLIDANYTLTGTVASTNVDFLDLDVPAAATQSTSSGEALSAGNQYSIDLELKNRESATITFDVLLK